MRRVAVAIGVLLTLTACSSAPVPPPAAPPQARMGAWSPAQLNLVAATGDPAIMPSTPGLSPGVIYVNRVYVDQAVPTRIAMTAVITGGAGITNSYLGLYDPADGKLLATTADISAQLQAGGIIKAPLTTEVPPQPMNKELWIALVMGGAGKSPAFVGGREYGTNFGQTGDFRLWVTADNHFTSLPTAIPQLRAPAHGSIPFVAVGP
ncbi:hypothetical protein [Amycolatopsis minnesotensis]|uniref:Lipoprotein n=1 Tax=Amycolatopsis minnesotensis TaxID=337894 RepID=A0ABP5CDD3_9PSEU